MAKVIPLPNNVARLKAATGRQSAEEIVKAIHRRTQAQLRDARLSGRAARRVEPEE
jgi:hypothetical protein